MPASAATSEHVPSARDHDHFAIFAPKRPVVLVIDELVRTRSPHYAESGGVTEIHTLLQELAEAAQGENAFLPLVPSRCNICESDEYARKPRPRRRRGQRFKVDSKTSCTSKPPGGQRRPSLPRFIGGRGRSTRQSLNGSKNVANSSLPQVCVILSTRAPAQVSAASTSHWRSAGLCSRYGQNRKNAVLVSGRCRATSAVPGFS